MAHGTSYNKAGTSVAQPHSRGIQGTPSLIDVLKLRMYEMGVTQAGLAKKIGVSSSRICDFLSGKSEPTMQVGRRISKKLNIDPAIVLGV